MRRRHAPGAGAGACTAPCCLLAAGARGGGGDGNTTCDCSISPDGMRVALRAERAGGCAPLGRTYTVTIEAVSIACAPHDRGVHGWSEASVRVLSPPPGLNRWDPCADGWLTGTSAPVGTCGGGCTW